MSCIGAGLDQRCLASMLEHVGIRAIVDCYHVVYLQQVEDIAAQIFRLHLGDGQMKTIAFKCTRDQPTSLLSLALNGALASQHRIVITSYDVILHNCKRWHDWILLCQSFGS